MWMGIAACLSFFVIPCLPSVRAPYLSRNGRVELGTHDLHSLSFYEVPTSFEAHFVCLPQKMEARLQADVKKARLLISLKWSICTFDLLQLLFVHTGSNGAEFMFLLKGHEDLRQDERVVQLFGLVNTLLAGDQETSKRHLGYVFSSVWFL